MKQLNKHEPRKTQFVLSIVTMSLMFIAFIFAFLSIGQRFWGWDIFSGADLLPIISAALFALIGCIILLVKGILSFWVDYYGKLKGMIAGIVLCSSEAIIILLGVILFLNLVDVIDIFDSLTPMYTFVTITIILGILAFAFDIVIFIFQVRAKRKIKNPS